MIRSCTVRRLAGRCCMERLVLISRSWSAGWRESRLPDSFPIASRSTSCSRMNASGAPGADETFGFTSARVYDSDPTRPTTSLKRAWEEARKRTRLHCPNCDEGRLAPAVAPAEGFACGSCDRTVEALPEALSKIPSARREAYLCVSHDRRSRSAADHWQDPWLVGWHAPR